MCSSDLTVRHQLSGNFGLLYESFWAWWGPLLVVFVAVASVRPPSLLAGVPGHVRRAVGVGAIGSLLLILLNDTGVTAATGSGLVLLAALLWCALERPPAQPAPPAAEPAEQPAPVPAEQAEQAEQAEHAAEADDLWKPAPAGARAQSEPIPAWQKPTPDWGDRATRGGPGARREGPGR